MSSLLDVRFIHQINFGNFFSSLCISARINTAREVTDTVCYLQTHIFIHMPKSLRANLIDLCVVTLWRQETESGARHKKFALLW